MRRPGVVRRASRAAVRAQERQLAVLRAGCGAARWTTCLAIAARVLYAARAHAAKWGRLETRIRAAKYAGYAAEFPDSAAEFDAAVAMLTRRTHAQLERDFAKPTARVAEVLGARLRYDQVLAACAREPREIVAYARGDAPWLTAGEVHAAVLASPELAADVAQHLALTRTRLLHVGTGASLPM